MWQAPGAETSAPPRFGAGAAVAAAVALVVLGIAFTFPLVAHLTDGLPFAAVATEGREVLARVQGDYLQFYYYLWLVRDRLLDGSSFLRDPYQFAVNGPRLNLPNTFLPFAVPFVAFSALGPRLAYNLLVLLSFPLAGLPTALLLHRYGVGRVAAVAGGAVFACLPYRMGALLGGHPAGLAFGLVPLTLWGLEAALAGSIAGGVWCAVALVSLSIVEPHFFYFAALGLPLYLLARLGLPGVGRDTVRAGWLAWAMALALAAAVAVAALATLAERDWTAPWPARLGVAAVVGAAVLAAWQCAAGGLAGRAWRSLQSRRVVAALGVAAAGALAGAAFMMLLRQVLLRRSISGAGRTIAEVLLFSPLPADLLVRANLNSARAIYLGAVAVGLAAIGTVALALRPPPPRARVLWIFPPLLALGTALSLGPRLTWLPLFEAAFHLAPFWNFVRQPAKFQVLTGLALAVLTGVGVAALTRALTGRRPGLARGAAARAGRARPRRVPSLAPGRREPGPRRRGRATRRCAPSGPGRCGSRSGRATARGPRCTCTPRRSRASRCSTGIRPGSTAATSGASTTRSRRSTWGPSGRRSTPRSASTASARSFSTAMPSPSR